MLCLLLNLTDFVITNYALLIGMQFITIFIFIPKKLQFKVSSNTFCLITYY